MKSTPETQSRRPGGKETRRVAIIRHTYYPQDQHVRKDAEALSGEGWAVDVICLRAKGQKSQETVNGVTVHRVPLRYRRGSTLRYMFEYSAFFVLAFFRMTWLSFRKRYSVVEIDSPPDFAVFAALVPRLRGARVILYVFDHMPEVFAEKYKLDSGRLIVRLLSRLEGASGRWADHVVAVNTLCQRLLEDRGVPKATNLSRVRFRFLAGPWHEAILQRNWGCVYASQILSILFVCSLFAIYCVCTIRYQRSVEGWGTPGGGGTRRLGI